MTLVSHRIAEMHTRWGRLINAHGGRPRRIALRIDAETEERLTAIAAQWDSTISTVAAEILEAAMHEAWTTFEGLKEREA